MTVRWLVIGLILLAIAVGWFSRRGSHRMNETKPIDSVTRPTTPVNRDSHIAACRECHEAQTESYLQVPHAQTLNPAVQPSEWVQFAEQSVRLVHSGAEFRYHVRDGRLWCERDPPKSAAVVDWIFGSGRHGQTAVTVHTNARDDILAQEHHVTWYAGHGLDRTIDRPTDLGRNKDQIGEVHDADSSRRCFGCHTTEFPRQDRRLELEHVVPGILCSRCHVGADQHADAMRKDTTQAGFDNWKRLSPFDSVARCGQCHRMPTDLSPKELTSTNRSLSRFASVGLLMSRCFQLQHTLPTNETARLDCVTCHNPHRPTPTDPEHYNRSCRECHRDQSAPPIPCPTQPFDSNCIECHMPKVSLEVPARFTDHWIRVPSKQP